MLRAFITTCHETVSPEHAASARVRRWGPALRRGAFAAVLSLAAVAFADASPSFSTASSSAVLSGPKDLALAQGDDGPNRFAHFRFEIHAGFNWYGAIGGGARLEFPIVPRGILTNVDDELALSFGAEVFYFYVPDYAGVGVAPLLALQWNFYVAQNVSLFPELGVAFLFGPARERYWSTFIAPYLGFGIRFHFTDRNALLLRGSWPAGLQIGITF
jgi:hypothetical protein